MLGGSDNRSLSRVLVRVPPPKPLASVSGARISRRMQPVVEERPLSPEAPWLVRHVAVRAQPDCWYPGHWQGVTLRPTIRPHEVRPASGHRHLKPLRPSVVTEEGLGRCIASQSQQWTAHDCSNNEPADTLPRCGFISCADVERV